MREQAKHFYAFGPFRLDSRERVLRRHGQPVPLTPKAVDILLVLVRNAEHLVDKDELMRQVWPDAFVEEGNLSKNIFALRKALGHGERGEEYIQTVARRGYRFAAKVQVSPFEEEKTEAVPDEHFRTRPEAGVSSRQARIERIDRGRSHPAAAQPEPLWEVPDKLVQPEWSPRLEAPSSRQTAAGSQRSGPLLRPPHRLRVAAAGVLVVLLTSSALLWLTRWQPFSSTTKPELKQARLTDNPSENPVASGAVSPDGRYLAYADQKGMHVKLIETGETADIRQPEELNKLQVSWSIVPTWVRDGTRFIANADLPGHHSSVWTVPVIGGVPQKIHDNGEAYSVSRDGARVAFAANWGRVGYRELWVMKPDGDQAHKLCETDENHAFFGAEWSPDSQRLGYFIWHEASDKTEGAIESRDLKGGAPVTALADATDLENWAWLPDGRIVYSSDEPGPPGESCNLWSVRVGSDGRPGEGPKRLTNWAGFCVDQPSPSQNSKRLVFRRWAWQTNIDVMDLDSAGRLLAPPHRLALTEGRNFPAAWTADSKALVFESYRDRQWRILKQSTDGGTSEPLATVGQMWNAQARLSPDGGWILYPDSFRGGTSAPYKLLRVPITGGRPEEVLGTRSYDSIQSRTAACARAPAGLCAIAERRSDGTQIVFTAFDPRKGREGEIARVDVDPTDDYIWDLSPDGTRIALLLLFGKEPGHSPAGRQIRLIPLGGQPSKEIAVKGWDNLQSVDWAADGNALFVSGATPQGSALLHVNLQGDARVLWQRKGGVEPWFALAPWAVPSPDGRHLAIYDWSLSANMWMMEDF
jgi:DNA-binding winged helix-turn-helix (wHTH) protein/Tol biopolymer transport system component